MINFKKKVIDFMLMHMKHCSQHYALKINSSTCTQRCASKSTNLSISRVDEYSITCSETGSCFFMEVSILHACLHCHLPGWGKLINQVMMYCAHYIYKYNHLCSRNVNADV
jgi:hypothetical protein